MSSSWDDLVPVERVAEDATSTPLYARARGRTVGLVRSAIDVPSMVVAGNSDWGTYQRPGAFERMQASACT
jgi:hypothetical protein